MAVGSDGDDGSIDQGDVAGDRSPARVGELLRRKEEIGAVIIEMARRWYRNYRGSDLADAVEQYEDVLRELSTLRQSGRVDAH